MMVTGGLRLSRRLVEEGQAWRHRQAAVDLLKASDYDDEVDYLASVRALHQRVAAGDLRPYGAAYDPATDGPVTYGDDSWLELGAGLCRAGSRLLQHGPVPDGPARLWHAAGHPGAGAYPSGPGLHPCRPHPSGGRGRPGARLLPEPAPAIRLPATSLVAPWRHGCATSPWRTPIRPPVARPRPTCRWWTPLPATPRPCAAWRRPWTGRGRRPTPMPAWWRSRNASARHSSQGQCRPHDSSRSVFGRLQTLHSASPAITHPARGRPEPLRARTGYQPRGVVGAARRELRRGARRLLRHHRRQRVGQEHGAEADDPHPGAHQRPGAGARPRLGPAGAGRRLPPRSDRTREHLSERLHPGHRPARPCGSGWTRSWPLPSWSGSSTCR